MGSLYNLHLKNKVQNHIVNVKYRGTEKDIPYCNTLEIENLELAEHITISVKGDDPPPYSLRLPSKVGNKYKFSVKWNGSNWVMKMMVKPLDGGPGPVGPTTVNVTVGEDDDDKK